MKRNSFGINCEPLITVITVEVTIAAYDGLICFMAFSTDSTGMSKQGANEVWHIFELTLSMLSIMISRWRALFAIIYSDNELQSSPNAVQSIAAIRFLPILLTISPILD